MTGFLNQLFGRPRLRRFALRPHIGAGPLRFGMTRAKCEQALRKWGLPKHSSHGASDYYLAASLQLEFSEEGTLWFIGFAPHETLAVTLRGQTVTGVPASSVAGIFALDESQPPVFAPNGMLFPAQILTTWEADPQYDIGGERWAAWGQIGIGSEDYLEAVSAPI